MLDLDEIRRALAAATPLYNETMVMSDSLADAIDRLYANAPTWLAQLVQEVDELRAKVLKAEILNCNWEVHLRVRAERDAALDENERLRHTIRQVEDPWFVDKTVKELVAWRACADKLWNLLDHDWGTLGDRADAITTYKRLKAGQ